MITWPRNTETRLFMSLNAAFKVEEEDIMEILENSKLMIGSRVSQQCTAWMINLSNIVNTRSEFRKTFCDYEKWGFHDEVIKRFSETTFDLSSIIYFLFKRKCLNMRETEIKRKRIPENIRCTFGWVWTWKVARVLDWFLENIIAYRFSWKMSGHLGFVRWMRRLGLGFK